MDAETASFYLEAIASRHSVRQYEEEPLAPQDIAALRACVDRCNIDGNLRFQLVTGEKQAFSGLMAHYGTFRGVTDYVALVGKRAEDLDERCGYYGERLALEAQMLVLNTCWAALTYRKIPGVFTVMPDEKLIAVIALGKGKNQGKPRRSKSADRVSVYEGESPEWFSRGVRAALLAPTALNQQKFKIIGRGDTVSLRAGIGPCVKIDLGIVGFHFECGAAPHEVQWE